MLRKQFEIVAKEIDADGGVIAINTGAVDRDQDRVLPSGMQMERYLRNPVVQWGHNYREPWATIGRTNELLVSDTEIVADFTLRPAANEQDPQSVVRLLWEGGWVNAASVGFRANNEAMEENEHGGYDFREWELLEWSLVPIPANQEALRCTVKALSGDDNADGDGDITALWASLLNRRDVLTCEACHTDFEVEPELAGYMLRGDAPCLCPDCAAQFKMTISLYGADGLRLKDDDDGVDDSSDGVPAEPVTDADDDIENDEGDANEVNQIPPEVLDALEEVVALLTELLESETEDDPDDSDDSDETDSEEADDDGEN